MQKPLSYIEISKKNLVQNLKVFWKLGRNKIASVVKANAYGHGQNEIAKIAERYVDYFQVDDLQELKLLYKVSQKPVLVLGYVAVHELLEVVRLGGILAIYDIERLKILNKIGKKLGRRPKVHIKIDANLGRQGILLEHLEKFLAEAKPLKHVSIEGIYTHFANIEDTSDLSHSEKQIIAFKKAVQIAEKYGFKNLSKHIQATSGTMLNRVKSNTIARIGIGMYGLWPSEELRKNLSKKFVLKPVMRWISHVAQVKTVPKNYSIGYGLTFTTKKPTKIAVIPQGYSDGYDRKLSNKGEVLIRGKRCKVLGRVAMNMFVVDVSHVPSVKVEDEVVLLGKQGKEIISAEEIAARINTINYEITTRISPLLPRIIT